MQVYKTENVSHSNDRFDADYHVMDEADLWYAPVEQTPSHCHDTHLSPGGSLQSVV